MSKIIIRFFLAAFLACANTLPIFADDSSKYRIVSIYSDLSDQEVVKSKAQEIFELYPTESIIVEVNDINAKRYNTLGNLLRGSWVENTSQYFIGDIFHATTGTIKCYVNGSTVSSCTGTVTIYGDKVTFKRKVLNNTSSTSANMYWEVMVSTATLGYRVYLFDR